MKVKISGTKHVTCHNYWVQCWWRNIKWQGAMTYTNCNIWDFLDFFQICLGGGFKYFYVHPYLGKMNPFWLIFFKWVGSTTNPNFLDFFKCCFKVCFKSKSIANCKLYSPCFKAHSVDYCWNKVHIGGTNNASGFELCGQRIAGTASWRRDEFEKKKVKVSGRCFSKHFGHEWV